MLKICLRNHFPFIPSLCPLTHVLTHTHFLRTSKNRQLQLDKSTQDILFAMDYTQQPTAAYQAPRQMSTEKQGMTPMGSDNNLKTHVHGNNYGSKWLFGFWDCCSPMSTCCLGTWCPCFLYGKTYAREHGEGETSGCSWMVSHYLNEQRLKAYQRVQCCAWYCAAQVGFNSCLQCITRGQQREKHGIEGSAFGDFCGALCCPCCGLGRFFAASACSDLSTDDLQSRKRKRVLSAILEWTRRRRLLTSRSTSRCNTQHELDSRRD